MIEHALQSLPGHVPLRRSINGVAHGHVIRGDCFGDCSRCATDPEKPARDLLSGSNFSESAVFRRVQINEHRLLMRSLQIACHASAKIRCKLGASEWEKLSSIIVSS